MSLLRPAKIDAEINVDRIKSRIIRSLLTRMDSFYCYDKHPDEYVFLDIQDRFWISMIDTGQVFTGFGGTELLELDYIGETVEVPKSVSLEVPTIRVIYVPMRHRGRRIQSKLLDYLKSVADESGESMGIFADAFELCGANIRESSTDSFIRYTEIGIEKPDDWIYQTAIQRERFLKAGFENVHYHQSFLTEPWQQFVYASKNCTDDERELIDNLKIEYKVNWDLIGKGRGS